MKVLKSLMAGVFLCATGFVGAQTPQPDSSYFYYWNAQNNAWEVSSSSHHQYDNQGRVNVRIERDPAGDTTYKILFQYDAGNRIIQTDYEGYVKALGQFMPASRYEYVYTGQGELVSSTFRRFENGGWVIDSKDSSAYVKDGQNRNTEVIRYVYNDVSQVLIPDSRVINTYYDATSTNPDAIVNYIWTGLTPDDWAEESRYDSIEYILSNDGIPSMSRYYYSYWNGTSWEPEAYVESTSSNGRIDSMFTMFWDGTTKVPTILGTYTYDQYGKQIYTQNMLWDGARWILNYASSDSTQYGSQGEVLETTSTSYSAFSGNWVKNSRTRHFYDNGPSGLNPEVFASARLFPNPAQNMVQVSLEGETAAWMLINQQGQILHQENQPSETIKLDVNHLRPGIYFLRLSNSKGANTLKFIKD